MSNAPASGTGLGILEFEKIGPKTGSRRRLAASPLKLFSLRTPGPVAWALSSHYGGGMVAGDEVSLQVSLGEGAEALIGTQAPGKVFGGEPGVKQKIQARVGSQAALAWLPDPLACFAGAIFSQDQQVDMEEGSSLLWCETLSCGRSLKGERWAFERYESRLKIRRQGRLLLSEALRLNSRNAALARRFGPYDAVASVFICGPKFAVAAQGILKALAEAPLELHAGVIEAGGAWASDGLVLRLAGSSAEALQQALKRRLKFVSAWLGETLAAPHAMKVRRQGCA